MRSRKPPMHMPRLKGEVSNIDVAFKENLRRRDAAGCVLKD